MIIVILWSNAKFIRLNIIKWLLLIFTLIRKSLNGGFKVYQVMGLFNQLFYSIQLMDRKFNSLFAFFATKAMKKGSFQVLDFSSLKSHHANHSTIFYLDGCIIYDRLFRTPNSYHAC